MEKVEGKKRRLSPLSADSSALDKDVVTCPSCDKELTDKMALETHSSLFCTTSVTNVNDENIVASLMVPGDESSKCVFCSVSLDSRDELVEHACTHLRCHLCINSKHNFKGLNDMRNHFERKHNYIPCLWCHYIFYSKKSLLKHFQSKHVEFSSNLKYAPKPPSQVLESVLKNKSLKLTSILRAIETEYPYLYLLEKNKDWKKEIISELYSNSRYGNTLFDKTRPDTLFYLENVEEVVLIGNENIPPNAVVETASRHERNPNHVPNHILQLVYEEEEEQLDEKNEGSRLVLNEAEEDIRRQEWFLRKVKKPWRVFGMCSLCGRLFGDNKSLHFHIKYGCNEESENSKKLGGNKLVLDNAKCPYCSLNFERFRDLVHHVLNYSCDILPKSSQVFVCIYCPTFIDRSEVVDHYLSRHMERNEKKSTPCKLCKHVCSSQDEFISHFLITHIGDIWTCCICQTQFLSLDAYEKHVSLVHPIYALSGETLENACSVCQVMFDSIEDRDLHLSNTMDHPVCWVCNMPAASWKDLREHFELNLADHASFYCKGCSKLFHKRKHKTLHDQLQHSRGLKDAQEETIRVFNLSHLPVKIEYASYLAIKDPERACKGCSGKNASFECSICYFPVHDLEELQSHVEKAKHKDLSCHYCLKHFLLPKELSRHYYENVFHMPANTRLLITSDEEDPNVESEDYPSNEFTSLTSNLELACAKCDSIKKTSILQNRTELLNHCCTFHPQIFRNVVCTSCNLLFTSKKLLKTHYETVCKKSIS